MPPRTRSQSADEPGKITTKQMREMHGALREHGITGDASVHDYIARALEEMDAEPVESRKELSTVLAAKIIADVEADPPRVERGPTPSQLTALRRPFDEEAIGKLPRSTCRMCSQSNDGTCSYHPNKGKCETCGNWHNFASSMHIDYVGHADVTARLLEVDPHWTWRPWSSEELMSLTPAARDAGLWIHLTVLGITRPGFGDADGKRGGNAVKEMIGDALRNAAMRFGVALDLWAKGDREWASAEKQGAEQMQPDPAQPRQDSGQPRQQQADAIDTIRVTADEVLGQLESYRSRIKEDERPTWEDFTLRYRTEHRETPITVEQLVDEPVERLIAWEQAVNAWINNPQPQQ